MDGPDWEAIRKRVVTRHSKALEYLHKLEKEETMNKEAELLDRIAALEARVAQLEARPQPATTIGGAGGWAFPWGTLNPAKVELSQTTGAIGTNVSRETSKGPNGGTGGPHF